MSGHDWTPQLDLQIVPPATPFDDLPKQCQRVLRYIRDFGSITQLDAIRDLGVMRLADVAFRLRGHGYEVHGELEEVTNRYGEQTHISRYREKDYGQVREVSP